MCFNFISLLNRIITYKTCCFTQNVLIKGLLLIMCADCSLYFYLTVPNVRSLITVYIKANEVVTPLFIQLGYIIVCTYKSLI